MALSADPTARAKQLANLGSKKCEPGCTCKRHSKLARENARQLGQRERTEADRKAVSDAKLTHGHSVSTKSPTYVAWDNMIQRCTNPNRPDYKNYGGRGIEVCDRWLDSFENFLSDMGEKPEGLTLDREDNDGDYEPGNCRWANWFQQSATRRKGNQYFQNG